MEPDDALDSMSSTCAVSPTSVGSTPRPSRLPDRWVVVVVFAIILLAGTLVTTGVVQPHSSPWPGIGHDDSDRDAAAAAEEFLRLVAESQRNDDTKPLPCTRVTEPGGVLNPCMDALKRRWAELEPIEEIGPSLIVHGVTSRAGTTAVVTDSNISPRPAAPISLTLEHIGVGAGARDWKVRQLNHHDLPH